MQQMRKVFLNRWFLLATALTVGFSALFFTAASRRIDDCDRTNLEKHCKSEEKGELLLDWIPRSLPAVTIQ